MRCIRWLAYASTSAQLRLDVLTVTLWVSGDKLDLCIVAVGLRESPVASDQPYAEALGEGDVNCVGHDMSGPQLIGALGEWLYRPTPNLQA